MKYLSVCSGIEAATVAWHPLGWEPVAFAEIDPFASALLAHHYPDTLNLGDITNHENWPIKRGAIDLLVGGTPCQSFSVAGLRRGLADPRGNLALTYLGILDHFRPRWCVWENVPGVLSSSGGRDFGAFLGALGELGYGFAYRVLDAQYVRVESHPRAVPQRRRRVFVVGHLGDWRRAAEVLLEPEGVRGDSPPRRETRKGFARGVGGGATDGGAAEVASTLRQRRPLIDAAGTLNRNDGQRGGFIWPQQAADPIVCKEGKTYTHEGKVFRTRNVVPSLQYPEVRVSMVVRRLTPRECERLQGFPDDYTLIEYRGKDAADGNRYKSLGNSMAVNVMRWIGDRIALNERAHRKTYAIDCDLDEDCVCGASVL